jgi:predicted AAA+ superfamily ATPase
MLEFEDVLNSCLLIDNLDTYVTGSNSKFLSKDIITEFRGRGDELYLRPLSFNEFYQIRQDTSFEKAWNEYITYGGLPYCVLLNNHEEKDEYLKKLFTEVYLKDILERNHIQGEYAFEQLLNIISSGIGSLTNLRKLENTYKSEINLSISVNTISHYIECLEDAFMIEKVDRYDVKGRKYISTQQKYYFTDLGLRNARLNFRQFEETHLMENAIYNELKDRGFSIDIGIVEINERQNNGKYIRKQTEIDFVCNKGAERIYIQSSFALPSIEKEQQEKRSLNNVYDSFRKIVIVKEDILTRKDSNGIITMGLKDFITNKNSLDEI